jgi:hypothetical protein
MKRLRGHYVLAGVVCLLVASLTAGYGQDLPGSWESFTTPQFPDTYGNHVVMLPWKQYGTFLIWTSTYPDADDPKQFFRDPYLWWFDGSWGSYTYSSQVMGRMTLNLHCAGQTLLLDGKAYVGGGLEDVYQQNDKHNGIEATHLFDPFANPQTYEFVRKLDMFYDRWYPTATMLPDGRVFVSLGDEAWQDGGGAWHILQQTVSEIYLPE